VLAAAHVEKKMQELSKESLPVAVDTTFDCSSSLYRQCGMEGNPVGVLQNLVSC